MALIAENIVEEYLNQNRYFTIRGVKMGVNEIDLLAVRLSNQQKRDALHVEVQVSENPVKYISNLTKKLSNELGKNASSATVRTEEQLRECVEDWVKRKFNHPKKEKVRSYLYPSGKWKFQLVHGNVKDERELELIRACGVETVDVRLIIEELANNGRKQFRTSSIGRDIINLFKMFPWKRE